MLCRNIWLDFLHSGPTMDMPQNSIRIDCLVEKAPLAATPITPLWRLGFRVVAGSYFTLLTAMWALGLL